MNQTCGLYCIYYDFELTDSHNLCSLIHKDCKYYANIWVIA